MTKRKKTILIISIILLIAIIVIAVYFLFLRDKIAIPFQTTPDQSLESETSEPQTFQASPQDTATPEESEYGQVKNLATSFAERYGSYSNQNNCQNLKELKVFMTQKMENWADNFIANSCNIDSESAYHAQTAKALSTQEDFYSSDLGQAEFTVKCQRKEFIGSPNNPSTYYQDIKVTLVKQESEWQIDSAFWQE